MPPFSQNPPSFPSFPDQKPPEQKFEEPKSGMDQQTRNTILFAVIFSVLAAGVLLFIFLKPDDGHIVKNAQNTSIATSTQATTTSSIPNTSTNTPQKKKSSWLSFFSFSFSEDAFTSKSGTGTSGMFNTSPSQTGTTKPTTQGTTTTPPTGTNITGGITTPPYSTQTEVPTEKLIGIYSELPSAEAQLSLEFLNENIKSSPLRGKIWISSVKRSTKVNQEYLILSTSKDLPAGTRITAMIIKSVVSGQTVQIGKGVAYPTTNDVNTSTDIFIEPGQKVYVNTSSSPIGYSFRINKCIGYFEQYQNFVPTLSRSCPLLKTYTRPAPPNQLQDPCLDYINAFPTCTITTSIPKSYADKLNDEQEYRCLVYIQNNTGYQNCAQKHNSDSDFLKPEWRTYLNWTIPLWKSRREVIWLLDQEGRFISQYSY